TSQRTYRTDLAVAAQRADNAGDLQPIPGLEQLADLVGVPPEWRADRLFNLVIDTHRSRCSRTRARSRGSMRRQPCVRAGSRCEPLPRPTFVFEFLNRRSVHAPMLTPHRASPTCRSGLATLRRAGQLARRSRHARHEMSTRPGSNFAPWAEAE